MKELSKGCNSYFNFFFCSVLHPILYEVYQNYLDGHCTLRLCHNTPGVGSLMLHGQCFISWHIRSIWQRTSKAGLKKQVFMPDPITYAWLLERGEIGSAHKRLLWTGTWAAWNLMKLFPWDGCEALTSPWTLVCTMLSVKSSPDMKAKIISSNLAPSTEKAINAKGTVCMLEDE